MALHCAGHALSQHPIRLLEDYIKALEMIKYQPGERKHDGMSNQSQKEEKNNLPSITARR